jgi:hypothetical protein
MLYSESVALNKVNTKKGAHGEIENGQFLANFVAQF